MSFESSEPLVLEAAPSQPERLLLGQKLTLFFAVPLTVLALYVEYKNADQAVAAMGNFKMLLLASYVVWLLLCFWVSNAYEDGLTWKEVGLVALWPLALLQNMRRGVKVLKGYAPESPERNGFRRRPFNENWAFCLGVNGTVATAYWWKKVVIGTIDVTPDFMLMAGFMWVLGMVVYFWTAEAWRNGLTLKEVLLVLLWPVGMLIVAAQGVRRVG